MSLLAFDAQYGSAFLQRATRAVEHLNLVALGIYLYIGHVGHIETVDRPHRNCNLLVFYSLQVLECFCERGPLVYQPLLGPGYSQFRKTWPFPKGGLDKTYTIRDISLESFAEIPL